MPPSPFDHPALHRVLCWPGLCAEAKLAWVYIWCLADLKPGTICVQDFDVGASQGARDCKRVGQRALKQLADHGLIVIVEQDGPEGRLRILDPAAVAQEPPSDGGGRPAA